MQKGSIIVGGGGLAGCCAALALSSQFHVTLVDDARANSASAIGAGLVNPLLGRQAHLAWRAHEAMAALDRLVVDVEAVHTVSRKPILRPALDQKQIRKYCEAASNHPELATWLDRDACAKNYPAICAPLGALQVDGCAIRIPDLLDQIVLRLENMGVVVLREHRVTAWLESGRRVQARVTNGPGPVAGAGSGSTIIDADRLLLCVGSAAPSHPLFANLSLHAVKGQVVETDLPEAARDLPHISGYGYVVVLEDRIILGSTWEHEFSTTEPTSAAMDELLARAANLSPALSNLTVREARAGVRVTVPRSYLPMVGPLPGHQRVWYFGGLGSKGLLMAPLIASELATFMADDRAIPNELAIR